ncbi:hypothetical protein cypCar_00035167 [Cyprinus carpio]|nr:hypothetical protein cypCar_00035167 [Cyprinus carpio]
MVLDIFGRQPDAPLSPGGQRWLLWSKAAGSESSVPCSSPNMTNGSRLRPLARSSTTTTTIVETKNDLSAHPTRSSKRTLTDDLHTTFSTPMAWILVLALIVTWSAVAVIMFDLLDSKGLEGRFSSLILVPSFGKLFWNSFPEEIIGWKQQLIILLAT